MVRLDQEEGFLLGFACRILVAAWAVLVVACSEPPPPAPSPPPAPVPVLAPVTHDREVQLRSGEVLLTLIERAGVQPPRSRALQDALVAVQDPRKLRVGTRLVLTEDTDGRLVRVAMHLDVTRVVDAEPDASGEGFAARWRQIDLETRTVRVSATIDSSLYAAFEAAGESPLLALTVSDALAWEIDFYRDLHPGDRIDLLVEKTTHEGQFIRYGKLVAARLEGWAGLKRFVRWERASGGAGYYDAEGRSARRALMRQPLPLVQITSHFGGRRHPILGFYKQHQGIDYAAPTGTPVWTVGDGVVTWAGYKGGNGLLVTVSHTGGFVSQYAHLSRLAAGIRSGVRVSQKQVVGHVGQTGLATGPHLHFALMRGGKFINPLGLQQPVGEPLPPDERGRYLAVAGPLLEQLAAPPQAVPEPSAEGPTAPAVPPVSAVPTTP